MSDEKLTTVKESFTKQGEKKKGTRSMLGGQGGYDTLLSSKAVIVCLENGNVTEIYDFSLVSNGESYTLGPMRINAQQQGVCSKFDAVFLVLNALRSDTNNAATNCCSCQNPRNGEC